MYDYTVSSWLYNDILKFLIQPKRAESPVIP